jgi:hypothetical protein
MTAHSEENLVLNPTFRGTGDAPEHWTFVTPRPELAPRHQFVPAENGGAGRLLLAATGDRQAFGCWRGEANLQPGQWYRASVRVRIREIAHPELSLFVQIAQHFLVPQMRHCLDNSLLDKLAQSLSGDDHADR